MIKFFRKIRQQLLTENKISKYLIYATGEIVLVVIGILIALQINDWNTERENEVLKRTYYVQILQDLEKDRNRLIRANQGIDTFFVRLQAYKELFKKPDLPLWEAATALGGVFSEEAGLGWNFETNTNTVNTLRNTGDIKLIPLDIRNRILDFRYKVSGLMDYVKSESIIIANASMATQKIYGGADMPTRIGNQPKILAHFGKEEVALRSLLELEAILYEHALLVKNSRERTDDLIREIDEITEIIREDLEQ
ncbi:hypothetical protein SAMN06265375_102240 [Muriicola jejuensis]|uniref:Uncharacterized protein n=1 Tax=Muriicola jejuensis TaxID=504488 RepID=A0A6P0UFW2_9FLAO|nr:DUF6090 family protein [Muriicola jejuensis]NER10779.1 hypothetical protein [Muriicola jejuensis]SMP16275.1 hypothetical protein SAMN06265375_102240 [Muriicola jejuensis]